MPKGAARCCGSANSVWTARNSDCQARNVRAHCAVCNEDDVCAERSHRRRKSRLQRPLEAWVWVGPSIGSELGGAITEPSPNLSASATRRSGMGHVAQLPGEADLTEACTGLVPAAERFTAVGRGERQRDREVRARLLDPHSPATLTNTSALASEIRACLASTASTRLSRLRSILWRSAARWDDLGRRDQRGPRPAAGAVPSIAHSTQEPAPPPPHRRTAPKDPSPR